MPEKAGLQAFEIAELKKKVFGPEPRFFEFLSGGRISGAVYRLPAGATDMQGPHLEDEIYIVLEGRARLMIDNEEHDVHPGLVLFIAANSKHSFVDIREDLTLLALFSATRKPF